MPRRSAVVHRAVSSGLVRARFRLKVHQKRDLGLMVLGEGELLLLDLFDYRFRRHNGLMLGAFNPQDLSQWRTIAEAKAAATGRFFGFDNAVDMEFFSEGARHACRIETFHRDRTAPDRPAAAARRFGFWADDGSLSLEELTLTVDLDDGYRQTHRLQAALATDASQKQAELGRLIKTAKEKPLSVRAARARRELSLRGPEGWKRLHALAKAFLRKQSYAALPIVRELANGVEPKRRDYLLKLARSRIPDDVRLAVLSGLLAWYPQDQKLAHAGLALQTRGRLEYFRELVLLGVPCDVLKHYAKDKEFAEEVYAVLRDRGTKLSAKELGELPRVRARDANSPAAARSILEDFKADQNWGIVVGLIGLLKDRDARVARGAYLLLLTLSGKDLPPDPDFWRSWLAAKKNAYEPPHHSAPGVVAAAILRGREFLKKDLDEDGACVWPVSPEWPGTRVGATALAVVALRAAGVSKDDPVFARAIEKTLLVVQGDAIAMRSDLDGYTYALSMLALALHSVDAKKYKPQLEVIGKRLAAGQLENGQWTYYCRDKKYKRVPKAGDNSNTQYAILALRACRLAGVHIEPEVWQRNSRFWLNTMNAWGGWGYGPRGTTQHELSMTSAGVATYAICAEALHGTDAARRLRESKRVKVGMRRLGELLLVKGYQGEEIYAYYGVERACILTGTRAFNDFDWYREGAGILVKTQKESGAWGDPEARGITTGAGYGEAIDTAYALLFLKRATTALAGAGGGGVVKVGIIRKKTVGGLKGR